jgi:hypothetical protein
VSVRPTTVIRPACLPRWHFARASALAAALALTSTARADGVAEQLFLDGKKLMAEGKPELACPKFEVSYKSDPTATGTLLNLALCHEAIGHTATAWAEYKKVIAESRGKREDRVELATQHVDALAPKLSKITIVVPDDARAPGLTVSIDGEVYEEPTWGAALPMDPGKHVIEARAAEKVGYKGDFLVGEGGGQATVTVPRLAEKPKEAQPESALGLSLLAEQVAQNRARRIVGYTLDGTGIAAIAVGAVFGVLAIGANDRSKNQCTPESCTEYGANLSHDANTYAWVSNVTIGLGLVAVVAGTVLIMTSKPPAGAERLGAAR